MLSFNEALECSKKGRAEGNGHNAVTSSIQMISRRISVGLQRLRFLPPGQKLEWIFTKSVTSAS